MLREDGITEPCGHARRWQAHRDGLDPHSATFCLFCELAEARALLAVRQVCEWKYDDTHEKYGTTCGHAWQFIDDGIAENGVHFCPFCGGFITEAASAGGE